jgi:hypothetical protein
MADGWVGPEERAVLAECDAIDLRVTLAARLDILEGSDDSTGEDDR